MMFDLISGSWEFFVTLYGGDVTAPALVIVLGAFYVVFGLTKRRG